MIKEVLLLAALGSDPSPRPSVPPGTMFNINATVCVEKQDMLRLIDASVSGNDFQKVYNELGGCDSYCITAIVIEEVRRFKMQDGRPFAMYEIIGPSGNLQSLWVATQVDAAGWPIKNSETYYEEVCVEQNKDI